MVSIISDPEELFPLYFEKFPPGKCPLRQAELISRSQFWDYFNSIKPMNLTEADWKEISEYEQARFGGFTNFYDFDIEANIFEYFPEFSGALKRKDLDGLTKGEKEELEGRSQESAKKHLIKELKIPQRAGYILRPKEVLEWLENLLDFREQVVNDYQKSKGLTQIISGLYLQKVDYTFFWYSPQIGRIIASYGQRTKIEDRLLALVSFDRPKLYSKKMGSKTAAQIDEFMWGRGEEALLGRAVETVDTSQDNKEEVLYPDIHLDGKQMSEIANRVFDIYGWDDWQVELTPAQETFSVQSTRNKLKVPLNTKRRLIKGLKTLAHEIEGHVLTSINEKKFFSKLKLYSNYLCDRFHPFAEIPAIIAADKTYELITGRSIESKPNPYFLVCLKKKASGGDFKSCFYEFGRSYAQLNGHDSFEKLKQSDNWDEFGNYAFPRLLRIFRNFTPLSDTSGEITFSKDTAYIEQKIIKEELEKRGLEKIFFAGHLNVYILPVLKKLGLLSFDQIQLPKYVIAKRIWPKIKSGLAKNKNIDEIIEAV